MRKWLHFCLLIAALFLNIICQVPFNAEGRNGAIAGTVTDSVGGVLPGARAEVRAKARSGISNGQGEFTIPDLPNGNYTLIISYVGFAPFSTEVSVTAGQISRVNAALKIAQQNEVVTVRGDRQRGEVEALNIERTADNIVQVLPSEVITSLPNTNIADAVGRLPSISLERDEGEGKYIQIRGTEPRLSNVTINGTHVPSPESVRNVKLDVIPADLVDMVEVNKTLSANQDADAIGGSVNLVTRTPTDQPYISVLGMGGYTPISGGRDQYQFEGTAGQRFGHDKKIGLLFGGSYDYNARGIHDIEPSPGVNSLAGGGTFLGPNAMDLRNYHYDRSRYGFVGDTDYRLGNMSSVYLRGLFSKFKDNGEDWIYSPSVDTFNPPAPDPMNPSANSCNLANSSGPTGCGSMGFTDVYRNPGEQIFSLQAGARHALKNTLIYYEVAASRHNTRVVSARELQWPGRRCFRCRYQESVDSKVQRAEWSQYLRS